MGAEQEPPRKVVTRLEVPGRTFAKAAIAIVLTLVVVWFINQVASVLVMIALSLLLAAVLDPLAGRLQRAGLGRGFASVLSVLAVVLVVLAFLALIVGPLIAEGDQLASDLPQYVAQIRGLLAGVPGIAAALERQAEGLRRDPSELFSGFLRAGVGVVSGIVSAVLIITLTLYFLIDKERVRSSVLRHVPSEYRGRVALTLSESARVVRGYFVGQAIVSSLFAAFTLLVLTVLGVPYAAVLAAIAFFLDAIPNIGATLATILPALVALPQGLTEALIVAGAFQLYQQVENNFISPRVLGGRLHVPPVLTLLAILVGGQVLGVIGILLAIPLAGVLPVIDRIWITGEALPASERGEGA